MTSASDSTRVYLDHAATSYPKPAEVADAVCAAVRDLAGNPGRGAHAQALEAGRAVLRARRSLADLLSIADSRDLVFTPSCTEACNVMIKGLLRPGDRVVVGSMEHNAVVRPLATLSAQGVDCVIVRADGDGRIDPDRVEAAVAEAPTRAVVCQHVSNVTGAIQPIGDLADIAHDHGAVMLCDGAQGAGHLDVDVGALDVDAYAVAGHKGLLGPAGVGALYLSSRVEPEPLVAGGTGSAGAGAAMPKERPERYEAGTLNLPGIVGLGAAAALLAERGDEFRANERVATERLLAGLAALHGIRILGSADGRDRIGVVSFVHESVEGDRIAFALDREYGVACRAGLHCAGWAHETIGTIESGAVRMSVGYASTQQDVDRALEALKEVVA